MRLEFLIHHHIVGLLYASDVLHAVFKRFCVEIVQGPSLGTVFQIPEPHTLSCHQLGLIFDREMGLFHFHVILRTEFPVVADPAESKA